MALGVEEFVPDQFAEGPRREEMFRVIRERFRQKTQAEWLKELATIDICFGPVNTIAEALVDPQVKARAMVQEVAGLKLIGSPLKFSDTPTRRPTAPPEFGQHTDEVLRSLGHSPERIKELRTRGVA